MSRGFTPERFVVMVHRRLLNKPADRSRVREVDGRLIRPARERYRETLPWATPGLLEQIMNRQHLIATQITTRYFAVIEDGWAVSSCELRVEAGTAQVETVETLPEYRKHGYARGVVTMAIEAARDCDFLFLVTDADDWPQQLYRRLSFDDVGIESRFLRRLDL